MGKVEVKDEEAGEAMLKGSRRSSQRKASSSTAAAAAAGGNWRKMFFCCIQAVEDEVQELDYQHAGLTDVPAEVFTHERTLEVLRLDCNQISDLPRPLFHCHGLKELWLTDNEIVQLPPALASLIHLEVLFPRNSRNHNYSLVFIIPPCFLFFFSSSRCWTFQRTL